MRMESRCHTVAEITAITAALEPGLSKHLGRQCVIRRLEHRLSDYRSSFFLEELDVRLDDDTSLTLIFKNLNSDALSNEARLARPNVPYDPLREIHIYREVLSQYQLGTPIYFAAITDSPRERYWLFLEKVPGVELYQIGDFALWQQVAQWLARFHLLGPKLRLLASEARLLHWNRKHYWRSLERARACVHERNPNDTALVDMERIARVYERVVEQLTSYPPTLIHGEFYASNVLVAESSRGVRVCPIDWETAGIGPGLLDLAALVAGRWTDEQREGLATAYWESLPKSWPVAQGFCSFQRTLMCARLALAVQLLGRTREWTPPPEHQHDWLQEAKHLAAQLS